MNKNGRKVNLYGYISLKLAWLFKIVEEVFKFPRTAWMFYNAAVYTTVTFSVLLSFIFKKFLVNTSMTEFSAFSYLILLDKNPFHKTNRTS